MPQQGKLQVKGRYTAINDFSAPEGALEIAENIDIATKGVATPTRGFEWYKAAFSSTGTDRAWKTFFFKDKPFVHIGASASSASALKYHDGSAWVSVGSVSAPSGHRIRTIEASQNLYFTTSTGIKKLESPGSTLKTAGAPQGLDCSITNSASASTWLLDDYRVAYRHVWCYNDTNGNLIQGPVSGRAEYINTTGSSVATDLTIIIPDEITTDWFCQIYRSKSVNNSVDDIIPDDELGQVFEYNPNSTDITNGYFTFTDIVPEEMRSTIIYTAASQQGLVSNNYRPPVAKDITEFRDFIFYANTETIQNASFTILAVDTAAGLNLDDTITIGGVTYTCKAAEDVANREFALYTGSSASINIRETASSLCRIINASNDSVVYAYYMSGPDDLPGIIRLEAKTQGQAEFYLLSSNPTFSNPNLPSTGTRIKSNNDKRLNGLYWSKQNIPEAVPLTNYQPVGDANKAIVRILPLRDSLLIIKEEGVYRLTGYSGQWNIDSLDSGIHILGPETAVSCNNQIFFLSRQGIVAIGDSASIISPVIDDTLLKLTSTNATKIQEYGFSVSYEDDKKFLLWLPEGSSSTSANYAEVFNLYTREWTTYKRDVTCGVANRKLYMAPTSPRLIEERKSFDFSDFVDPSIDVVIDSVVGEIVTLSSGYDQVLVGDSIKQGDLFTTVEELLGNNEIRIYADPGFTAASAVIQPAIDVRIKWLPFTANNPGIQKQAYQVELFFKKDFNRNAKLWFSSDLSLYDEETDNTGDGLGHWGLKPWGGFPWGGDNVPRTLRQWVPLSKQRHTQLRITYEARYAHSDFALQGIAVFYTPGSELTGK